ncbi:kinase-like domain-containing protein [Lipomyces oligophaga]|uniref:kinase-like domain-containing protein n=1 Tax=Lipomyces oligophaga TaxID=45792 RepID=UPI0034CE77EF
MDADPSSMSSSSSTSATSTSSVMSSSSSTSPSAPERRPSQPTLSVRTSNLSGAGRLPEKAEPQDQIMLSPSAGLAPSAVIQSSPTSNSLLPRLIQLNSGQQLQQLQQLQPDVYMHTRSASFDSPLSATFYRDLTPLPSPIVSSWSTSRSPSSSSSTASSSSSSSAGPVNPALSAAAIAVSASPAAAAMARASSRTISARLISNSGVSATPVFPLVTVLPPTAARPRKPYGELDQPPDSRSLFAKPVGSTSSSSSSVSLRPSSPPTSPPESPFIQSPERGDLRSSPTKDDPTGLGISSYKANEAIVSSTSPLPSLSTTTTLTISSVSPSPTLSSVPGTIFPVQQKSVSVSGPDTSLNDPMKRELVRGRTLYDTGEVFEAYEGTLSTNLRKVRWKEERLLGKGTFSRVVLARRVDPQESSGSEQLVAVKIVELSAAGGASRERIESGLKREVEILKELSHPCLIQLVAFNLEPARALIVLPFCIGGDLFDVATSPNRAKILQAPLVQRVFGEIVSAVKYLHEHNIVHRDLKLENVLLNFSHEQLLDAVAGRRALTTLADFGLSRHIDPDNPLLTTRCGSEDYAPPEIIMGQAYDGRQTDSWALGVLLFSLMEGRFPFDGPPPNFSPDGQGTARRSSGRNRVKHRIARVEWAWYKYSSTMKYDEEAWTGAKIIVDNCLKRRESRWGIAEIAQSPWCREVLALNLIR